MARLRRRIKNKEHNEIRHYLSEAENFIDLVFKQGQYDSTALDLATLNLNAAKNKLLELRYMTDEGKHE